MLFSLTAKYNIVFKNYKFLLFYFNIDSKLSPMVLNEGSRPEVNG